MIILALCGLLACALVGMVAYAAAAGPARPAALPLAPTRSARRSMPPAATPTPVIPPTARPTLTPTQPAPPPDACLPANTEILLGQVTAVLDGENIQVEVLDGRRLTIGYAGITVSPAFTAQNSALVAGQQMIMVKDAALVDEPGRLPRYVMAGDRFVNYELLRQGYARAAAGPELACAQVFQAAEAGARAARLGVWAPTSIPTLTFVPTVGSIPGDQANCDCSVRWTCADFNSHARAQACFIACQDYNSRLDEDHDGLACEELP